MSLNESRGSTSSSSKLLIDESSPTSPIWSKEVKSGAKRNETQRILASSAGNKSFIFGNNKPDIADRLGYGIPDKNGKTIFDDDDDDDFDNESMEKYNIYARVDPPSKKNTTQGSSTGKNSKDCKEGAQKLKEIDKREKELAQRRKELDQEEKVLQMEKEKKRLAKKEKIAKNSTNNNDVIFLQMENLKLEKVIAEKEKSLAEKDVKIAHLEKEIVERTSTAHKIQTDLYNKLRETTQILTKLQKEQKESSLKKRLGARPVSTGDTSGVEDDRLQKSAYKRQGASSSFMKRRIGRSLEGDGFSETTLDPEDILTEFGENGPVAAKKIKK